jgi:RNA polymerase sigma-70 factor (ECF subfamily)
MRPGCKFLVRWIGRARMHAHGKQLSAARAGRARVRGVRGVSGVSGRNVSCQMIDLRLVCCVSSGVVTDGVGSPNSHDGDPLDPPVDPDADIRALVKLGKHHEALRLLMRRHGRMIYRYCRGMVRDDARADDVHQKVFIEAHRDLPTFAGRSTVRTWLLAIAHNRAVDDVRKHQREESRIDRQGNVEVADSSRSSGERLDEQRLREALAQCVDELPPAIRAAVLLRYQQGLTFEQMAEVCDEKPGTLQARVSRAVDGLRACIEKRTGGVP